MKKNIKLLVAMAFVLMTTFSLHSQSESVKFVFDKNISIASAGETVLEVKVTVPKGNYIYIGHKNPQQAYTILTTFEIIGDKSVQILKTEYPQGKAIDNDIVFSGSGSIKLHLFEFGLGKVGSHKMVDLKILTQLCSDKGVCFEPYSFVTPLKVNVTKRDDRVYAEAIKTKSRSLINWVTSYNTALEKAKKENKNVYAIVTAPSWCGACIYMEKEAFAKAAVADMLNKGFVALRILDTNKDISKFKIGGYPTNFILNAQGSVLKREVGGIGEQSLLALLEPYSTKQKQENYLDDLDDHEFDDDKNIASCREILEKKRSWKIVSVEERKRSFGAINSVKITGNNFSAILHNNKGNKVADIQGKFNGNKIDITILKTKENFQGQCDASMAKLNKGKVEFMVE